MPWWIILGQVVYGHADRHVLAGPDSFASKAMAFLSARIGTFIVPLAPTRYVCANAAGDLVDGEYWDDLVVPATLANLVGPASPPVYNETDQTIDFGAAGTNTIQINYQMPHRWKEGTEVRFHLHAMPSTADAGNVVWEHKYRWIVGGEVAGAWTTTTQTEAASGTAGLPAKVAIKAISAGGRKISDILQVQVQRLGGDGADTYPGLMQAISLDLHYKSDAPGSVAELTK